MGLWCPRRIADAEQRSKRPIAYYLPAPCTILQMGHLNGLAALDDDTVDWLKTIALKI